MSTSIGATVLLCASALWNVLPSGVQSVENIANFCRHLKLTNLPIHHNFLAYQTILLKLPVFIDSEIDQPFCIYAPLISISKDLDAIEVT